MELPKQGRQGHAGQCATSMAHLVVVCCSKLSQSRGLFDRIAAILVPLQDKTKNDEEFDKGENEARKQ